MENSTSPDKTAPFAEQDENGIDLSHLRANLKLTPTERLEKHRLAYERAVEVQNAALSAGLRHRSCLSIGQQLLLQKAKLRRLLQEAAND